MSSNASVALLRGWVALIAILIGFLPVGALAQSARTQSTAPMQAVAATEPHSEADVVIGSSTVLKIPTPTARRAPSSAAAQPIQGSTPRLIPASAIAPLPAKAATGMTDVATPSTTIGTTAAKIGAVASAPAPHPALSAASVIQSQIDGIELLSPGQRRTYRRAASAFTVFCRDWERLLHEREVNNLEHLNWRADGGFEAATYTGYGRVESCECKASKEGLPIGKIRYHEINYSIAGKTIDEARHAAPKSTHEISTLEIFSWDKGKWFY